MAFLDDEQASELMAKLEGTFESGDSTSSETVDVKPEVEAAQAAEETVEARTEAPDVPDAPDEPEAEAGKSEGRQEASSGDGPDETDSTPPGHRVPYKRFKGVLDARNKYRGEAEEASAQLDAFRTQMETMRNEVANLRNIQPAQPAGNPQIDPFDAELDRLLGDDASQGLPKEVTAQMQAMEARIHQQEVHVERERLRREVADVTTSYDEGLRTDIQHVLYNAVQRDPNVDLGRTAEQYVAWLATREEAAIARYLADNPQGSTPEAAETAPRSTPARPRRAGTGASSIASAADNKGFKTIAEGSGALFDALKKGRVNLFG
jgi:hypothetical protein